MGHFLHGEATQHLFSMLHQFKNPNVTVVAWNRFCNKIAEITYCDMLRTSEVKLLELRRAIANLLWQCNFL